MSKNELACEMKTNLNTPKEINIPPEIRLQILTIFRQVSESQ